MRASYEIDFSVQAESLLDAKIKAENFLEEQFKVYEYSMVVEPEIVSETTLGGDESLYVGAYLVTVRGEI